MDLIDTAHSYTGEDSEQTIGATTWLLTRSPTTLTIPGTLSREHLRENLAASEIELTDEEFEALR